MLLPLLLIVLAAGAASMMAYGTHPGLADAWPRHGLDVIILSRRLEWPLITLALLCSLALLFVVISGKRRTWWLIGLAPVMALFVHRFAPWRGDQQYILELDSSQFVAPSQNADDEWVVGVVFQGQPYALPYRQLFTVPILFLKDYDKRMVLLFSAYANRALAFDVTRELKARDLEIVCTASNSLLVQDRRLGEFFLSVTGETPAGRKPTGFTEPVETTKTTRTRWFKQHPNSRVMPATYVSADAPGAPLRPRGAGTSIDGVPFESPVTVIDTSPPSAMLQTGDTPAAIVNRVAGPKRLLVITDPTTGRRRIFDRNVNEDLFPTFSAKSIRKQPDVFMSDSDTGSLWTIDAKAIDGPLKGSKLKEIEFEDGVYYGPLKRWLPQLSLSK